jgi:hypothetical protein
MFNHALPIIDRQAIVNPACCRFGKFIQSLTFCKIYVKCSKNPGKEKAMIMGGRKGVRLRTFFEASANNYLKTRDSLAAYDQVNPFSPEYSAMTRGMLAFELRKAAALTAISGRCLDYKLGAVPLPSDKAFCKLFLGSADVKYPDGYSELLRYPRDLDKDQADADRAIARHAPALVSQPV